MRYLVLSNVLASVAVNPFTEAITPFLPLFGTIVGAIVVGVFALWNRKRGNLENRAPEVNEIWAQQNTQSTQLDMERRLRRRIEDLLYGLRKAFKSYVARVQAGGSTQLTAHEIAILDRDVDTRDLKSVDETKE